VQGSGVNAATAFWYLSDAITKAYELGAQYTSATVTIRVIASTGSNLHMLKPHKATEFLYIPTKYDDQQSTKLVI
jgi:hypothetical protein